VETGHLFNGTPVETKKTTFQLQQKYIISTIKSGLVMIDQNRAHQRILYENYLKQLTLKEATSQQLLFPLKLQFSQRELTMLDQMQADLEHTGFVFSKEQPQRLVITGVPVGVSESEVSIILDQLLSDMDNDIPDANFSATDLLAKSMAKSLSIKNGQYLTAEAQEHLVNQLFACKEPNISPTNRPTFITMSVEDLEKRFM
jgi:DNA mismatch repair protein MutL